MAADATDRESGGVTPTSLGQLTDVDQATVSGAAAGVLVKPAGANAELVVVPSVAAIADVPTGGSATAAANATAINSILAALRGCEIVT